MPHRFLAELPITDEHGFVLTDRRMRNPLHPEIYAVGDAAALVPKFGSLGHQQPRSSLVRSRSRALQHGDAGPDYQPEILCFGDIGGHQGFSIHSNTSAGRPACSRWATRPTP